MANTVVQWKSSFYKPQWSLFFIHLSLFVLLATVSICLSALMWQGCCILSCNPNLPTYLHMNVVFFQITILGINPSHCLFACNDTVVKFRWCKRHREVKSCQCGWKTQNFDFLTSKGAWEDECERHFMHSHVFKIADSVTIQWVSLSLLYERGIGKKKRSKFGCSATQYCALHMML